MNWVWQSNFYFLRKVLLKSSRLSSVYDEVNARQSSSEDLQDGWVGSLQRQVNWTDGCIAVTNSEIEEIWPLVPVGTPLETRP